MARAALRNRENKRRRQLRLAGLGGGGTLVGPGCAAVPWGVPSSVAVALLSSSPFEFFQPPAFQLFVDLLRTFWVLLLLD